MIAYLLYWTAVLLLGYTFVGYGLLIAWLPARRINKQAAADLPTLTLVIPAYNEAAILAAKIRNTQQQQYPGLQIVVVADGSTDDTAAVVGAFPDIVLLSGAERQGKPSAINRALAITGTELVAISDANAMLSPGSLAVLAGYFSDPEIGGMSGEKKVQEAGEGMYWKYESWLKRNDARINSLVGAAGELFVFRRRLFVQLEPDTILDDFMLSMRIAINNYRVGYAPEATATETGSRNTREENKRKVRIAAGGFQSISRLHREWSYVKTPFLAFQYWSHRVFRWAVTPWCLPVLLVANGVLTAKGAGNWYWLTAGFQIIFYAGALVGWAGNRFGKKWPFVYLLYYFVFMQLAVMQGWLRFRQNRQQVLWEKSHRAA